MNDGRSKDRCKGPSECGATNEARGSLNIAGSIYTCKYHEDSIQVSLLSLRYNAFHEKLQRLSPHCHEYICKRFDSQQCTL